MMSAVGGGGESPKSRHKVACILYVTRGQGAPKNPEILRTSYKYTFLSTFSLCTQCTFSLKWWKGQNVTFKGMRMKCLIIYYTTFSICQTESSRFPILAFEQSYHLLDEPLITASRAAAATTTMLNSPPLSN